MCLVCINLFKKSLEFKFCYIFLSVDAKNDELGMIKFCKACGYFQLEASGIWGSSFT